MGLVRITSIIIQSAHNSSDPEPSFPSDPDPSSSSSSSSLVPPLPVSSSPSSLRVSASCPSSPRRSPQTSLTEDSIIELKPKDVSLPSTAKNSSGSQNIGSLLRLFQSEFFDSWMGVSYLFRYPSKGVHDYICNRLFSMPDDEIEFYLVELVSMVIHNHGDSDALERFILEKCSKSIHFALLVSWLFCASADDSPAAAKKCDQMQRKCEQAVVHGTTTKDLISPLPLLGSSRGEDSPGLPDYRQRAIQGSMSMNSDAVTRAHRRTKSMMDVDDSALYMALSKKDRCEYFNKNLEFIEELGKISDRLRVFPVARRQQELEKELNELNERLAVGLYLPIWQSSHKHFSIVRLEPKESKVLKSRERCPYILFFEMVESDFESSAPNLQQIASFYGPIINRIKTGTRRRRPRNPAQAVTSDPNPLSLSSSSSDSDPLSSSSSSLPVSSSPRRERTRGGGASALHPDDKVLPDPEPENPDDESDAPRDSSFDDDNSAPAASPYGELYREKQERIRSQSPFGIVPTWKLSSAIVKFGDDCRQEYLAMQLIGRFKQIFDEAHLSLWLRPYRILVNTPNSGLIETLTDCLSIHGIKKFYDLDPPISLVEHFRRQADNDDRRFKKLVHNFTESLAGYSLVSYLLQFKDRHNGNLMIDRKGHLIHIDFGFMLGISPGGINAEGLTFKLTSEFVEVMGGTNSAMFYYFKVLMIQGFLEVRKRCEDIILLVEIMGTGSKLPCFQAGVGPTVEALRERFKIGLTDDQTVKFIEKMIVESTDNWRTRYYDHFQYLTNGIVP
eukprot:TRINITY_DN2324_c0_g1_i2.p1 TRINITY_DN2324_c0_g1~~TRINITY_DN2324_c0_g1_i2.p1  ORF type:complete len:849 (+),score=275.90 TRINITY_DN2324_c0_g1_i2:188-2548(+)